MPNWKKVVVSGSNAILNSLNATGPITGSDVKIDDWGSVSASLASIEAGATSTTLQEVTDNGSTTTNSITISGSSADLILTGGNTIETDNSVIVTNKKTCANGAVTTLFLVSPSTYVGAVVDYTVYTTNRSNQRTGIVTITANSSTVKHSELVTTDIGDTDGVIVDARIAASNFEMIIDNNSGNSFDIVYSYKLLKI